MIGAMNANGISNDNTETKFLMKTYHGNGILRLRECLGTYTKYTLHISYKYFNNNLSVW